ncbi:MAG: hypothetical protein LBI33_12870 [Propionibacteriaceae bacterium]|nr:hypothetical protein [Propionibacteriaceae bacterium]
MIVPKGITSTGYPDVKTVLDGIGVFFDRWQQGMAQLILAKRLDGKYVATVGGVVLSIARQTGKTYVVRWVVFALCVLFPGIRVVWTSHHSATTALTVAAFQEMAKHQRAKKYVRQVKTANGQESCVFRNGSEILFGARESGFGRGFDAVSVLVFDEAQIMKDKALQGMIPSQNVGGNPLLLFMGTPPTPADASEVFTTKRDRALAGRGTAVYIEISCDPVPANKPAEAWMRDRRQWGKGNPSFRTGRTDDDSMLRMVENLTIAGPEGMLREGLGLWDAEGSAEEETMPRQAWAAQLVTPDEVAAGSRIVSDVTVCVAATRKRSWVYVARCGERADGTTQVELLGKWRQEDVADYLADHKDRIRVITGQARGDGLTSELVGKWSAPAAEPWLRRLVTGWEGAELTAAYGRGLDALEQGSVATVQADELDACVPDVVWKLLGGGQVIDTVKSKSEQAPLKAWFGAYGMRTRAKPKQVAYQPRVAPVVVKQ